MEIQQVIYKRWWTLTHLTLDGIKTLCGKLFSTNDANEMFDIPDNVEKPCGCINCLKSYKKLTK